MMNIFEKAARRKFRFQSDRGLLSVEQLFDLPLRGSNGFNLDSVARAVNTELQSASEESFVPTASTSALANELSDKLEIVKHIIAAKVKQQEINENRAAKQERRRKILEAIEQKDNAAIGEASREELLKELEELEAE